MPAIKDLQKCQKEDLVEEGSEGFVSYSITIKEE
jgi:hypothetical protein